MSAARDGAGDRLRGPGEGIVPRPERRPLVARQVRYEQLSFWLNPIGALMTIAFSVVFLILLGATAGTTTVSSYGHIKLIDYYVAGFCAYGVMAACFTILAIQLVNRREVGLLKRLRLSPLPTWMAMAAVLSERHDHRRAGRDPPVAGGPPRLRRPRPGHTGCRSSSRSSSPCSLQRAGRGHEHVGAQRRCRGADGEPHLLHPGRAVGTWFPIPPGSGLATFADYFPIRHLITRWWARSPDSRVRRVALARPGRHGRSGAWAGPSWGCAAGAGRPGGAESALPSAGQPAVDHDHLPGDVACWRGR